MSARHVLVCLLPLLAIGSTCQQPPVRVTAPGDGTSVTWMPLDVTIRLKAGIDAATLEVELNGHEVGDHFTVDAPEGGWQIARATHLWDGMVLPGINTLEARVRNASGSWSLHGTTFEAVGDPYADAVTAVEIGQFGGFPSPAFLPGIVLGPPRGTGPLQGSFDVFSLGFGGEIELVFVDNVIVDGPGVDFTVFENAFLAENPATLTIERPFADPGIVAVSQDGAIWHEFPCQLATNPTTALFYPGCAGVYPVYSHADQPETPHASIPTTVPIQTLIGVSSEPPPNPGGAGGDSFDLADVGLAWARYVRIRDPDHWTGDPFGATNAGFDLDAIAAIHSGPSTDTNDNGVPDAFE